MEITKENRFTSRKVMSIKKIKERGKKESFY